MLEWFFQLFLFHEGASLELTELSLIYCVGGALPPAEWGGNGEICGVAGRVDEAEQGSCKPCDYKLESLEGMEISAFNTTKLAVMGKTDVFMYRIVPPGKGGVDALISAVGFCIL